MLVTSLVIYWYRIASPSLPRICQKWPNMIVLVTLVRATYSTSYQSCSVGLMLELLPIYSLLDVVSCKPCSVQAGIYILEARVQCTSCRILSWYLSTLGLPPMLTVLFLQGREMPPYHTASTQAVWLRQKELSKVFMDTSHFLIPKIQVHNRHCSIKKTFFYFLICYRLSR